MSYNRGFATGIFEPHPAFAQISSTFEQAPDRPYTDFFRKFANLPAAVVPFCQARDGLHLQLWRSDGQQVAARIVAIQYEVYEQLWTIAVHTDDEHALAVIADAYQMNAAAAFAEYTRLWQEKPRVGMTDDAVVARAIQILARKTKNNPVLVDGPSERRCDALAAVVAAVRREGTKRDIQWDVVALDPRCIRALPPYRQASNTLEALLLHSTRQVSHVLFIIEQCDQLATWADCTIRSFLARRQVQIVGTATLADYCEHIERNMLLQCWMQEVLIERMP
ncbi:MAG: hypothetical protein H0X24_06990 [Ktedonobacterales bacterium]|nr:hypothetical protein [Ktedonobacterales bacterium]